MMKLLIRGSLSAPEMGPVRRRRAGAAGHWRWSPRRCAAAGAAIDLGAREQRRFLSLPAIERFQARDGTWLGFRHYPASGPPRGAWRSWCTAPPGPAAAPSTRCRQALAERGVETFAVDMRGHGASGTRGDIGYVGQLEDDLADFVAVVRKTVPSAPLTLVGHSSGGGFALRVAGSPIQNLFERTVLLAPYLGYDAPSTRPGSGGWAKADIPRIIGLAALRASASTAARRCRCWRSRCRRIPRRRWWGPIPTG